MENNLESKKNRMGIFICSDNDGVVDGYISYLLRDVVEVLTDLIIVFNGKSLLPESREKLYEFTDHVIVFENKGFDVEAWKFAMTKYWSWEEIDQFDEIILFNDSFFGPFISFKQIFDEMERHVVDFWGVVCCDEKNDIFNILNTDSFQKNIQSNFIVIRKKMHISYEFKDFWDNVTAFKTYENTLENHNFFTKYFEKKGFTWDSYVSEKGCPILDRTLFEIPLVRNLHKYSVDLRQCLSYIKTCTNYDVNLIWEHVVRKYNISDIFQSVGLQFILSKHENVVDVQNSLNKAVIIVSFEEKNFIHILGDRINCIPEDIHLILLSGKEGEFSKNILEGRKNVKILYSEHYRNNILSFLLSEKDIIRQYQYICIFSEEENEWISSMQYKKIQIAWDNLLGDRANILHILQLFSENKEIGLFAPAIQAYGEYKLLLGNLWDGFFEETRKLANYLKLGVPIEKEKQPLTTDLSFWIKADVLKRLWSDQEISVEFMETVNENNCALRYIFPFIAQSGGYCTAWVATERWTTIEAMSMRHFADCLILKTDKIQNKLRKIRDIIQYFDTLNFLSDDYTIILSVRDTPGDRLPVTLLEKIHRLGFSKFDTTLWKMYVGIIRDGKVVCNKSGEIPEVSVTIRYYVPKMHTGIYVTSRSWKNGDKSEIMIDGTDYSTNSRGINIVVYNERTGHVLDSIGFDGHTSSFKFVRYSSFECLRENLIC